MNNDNNEATDDYKIERDEDDFGEDDPDFADDDDDAFDDSKENDDDGWGDAEELNEEELAMNTLARNQSDPQELLRRAREQKRREFQDITLFWKCGSRSCNEFLNHPTRALCMACGMPKMDIVYGLFKEMVENGEMQPCKICEAFIHWHQLEEHEDFCFITDMEKKKLADWHEENDHKEEVDQDPHPSRGWKVKLSKIEQGAINYVSQRAIKKNAAAEHKTKIMSMLKSINKEWAKDDMVWDSLHHFFEWTVPIIIHVHCAKLIPLLLKDTHYRNLFEIGKGSGCNNQTTRANEERKCFGDVYDKGTPHERPKYGCLNVGLQDTGCKNAMGYGDGFFIMNDTTVRWRTTLTILDSFAVNGETGTLKYCDHLLAKLNQNELKELCEAALYAKKGGQAQGSYREIQIHGPVRLDRDIVGFHVPDNANNRAHQQEFEEFVKKNGIKTFKWVR